MYIPGFLGPLQQDPGQRERSELRAASGEAARPHAGRRVSGVQSALCRRCELAQSNFACTAAAGGPRGAWGLRGRG
jgi:hypothetical protein